MICLERARLSVNLEPYVRVDVPVVRLLLLLVVVSVFVVFVPKATAFNTYNSI